MINQPIKLERDWAKVFARLKMILGPLTAMIVEEKCPKYVQFSVEGSDYRVSLGARGAMIITKEKKHGHYGKWQYGRIKSEDGDQVRESALRSMPAVLMLIAEYYVKKSDLLDRRIETNSLIRGSLAERGLEWERKDEAYWSKKIEEISSLADELFFGRCVSVFLWSKKNLQNETEEKCYLSVIEGSLYIICEEEKMRIIPLRKEKDIRALKTALGKVPDLLQSIETKDLDERKYVEEIRGKFSFAQEELKKILEEY